ncbi:death-inducer obliterator 1 isoform X1 [Anguilla rostrata]|uniref:death-inducer obliterator 1 isoform X1 n=1 Tax=Anguilla rostrata TaxID=7938 RepID=UPI0030CCBABA
MFSDTDPLLPSCSEPYQLGLKCVPDQDNSQNTASAADEKEGHANANDDAEELVEPVKVLRPTSKEFKKTWGFRRTTIAQRGTPGSADREDGGNGPVRRRGRQARRACEAEESISPTKRGRGGRKSAPVCLESPKPPSQMPSDTEAPSEASITIGRAEAGTTEEAADTRHPLEREIPPIVSVSDDTSSDQADSDELTLKELRDRLKKQHVKDLMGLRRETQGDSLGKEDEQNGLDRPASPEAIRGMSSGTSAGGTSQDSSSTHKTPEPTAGEKTILNGEEEEELPGKSDRKSHCPDTLYCICRQKHNKRFMICCDRCEEWFHGDCVGITEAHGRLLERNRKDYTCPNCTLRMSQAAASESLEGDRQPSSCAAESPPCQAVSSPAGMEENHEEDQAIKGEIEGATTPSEKKKMKIFHPVEETSSLPKCIGPGCDKSALPDSVYCGTECILKHAAATMKSLPRVKEPSPTPQPQKKLVTKTFPKCQKRSLSERTVRRSLESWGGAEEDESSSEEEAVEEQDQTAPLWSSDHDCITVNPEKTTAIPSAVFYKSSQKESEEIDSKKGSSQLQQKSPLGFTFPRGNKKTAAMGDPPSKRIKLVSKPVSSDGDSKDSTFPPSKCPTSRKRSPAPALTSQPSCSPTSSHHALDALRLSTASYSVPSKLPRQQHLPPAPSLAPAAPSKPPQPNITIRHNIRRSLTEILGKRVSDSDDLDMSESSVGKLAVSIEKEMYCLFLNTDNNYKRKYRSIMFNLKDPKNKGLFYQVVMGEVTPFKLVRLSPEELLSKGIAGWIHPEKAEVLEPSPKARAGLLKRGLKQGHSPCADLEESPPAPDGDACISATSSSPCMASAPEREDRSHLSAPANPRQPNVVSPDADLFSKMLKDTTSEHRTHLFNLNCKICTGQISAEEEPIPKKVKNSVNKKAEAEPKAKQLCRSSKVGNCLGDDSSRTPLDSEMYIMESPASPDDTSSTVTLAEPVTIPAVPSVVIAGRDPRTASYRPPITVTSAVPTVSSVFESKLDIMPVIPPPAPPPLPPPPPPTVPKSILLKPTSSSAMRFFTASGSSSSMMDSHSPPGGDTALFLSKQEVLWKGFINMHSVAKFVIKAYLVSGSSGSLKEDLPDTIQIGGRISPDTVWDYVAKIKTSLTKELCLIRFHPATEEEEVAYISLFSYFNSRGRFGVVANNSRRIKDLYLIPLGAKAPIPSKLVPIEGPGLEKNHPNLLLGLAICQKPKCSGVMQGEEDEEKGSKFQTGHSDHTSLPHLPSLPSADINQDKARVYIPKMLISTTPPGSPSSVSSSDSSSSSFSTSLLLHQLKPVKASVQITANSGKDSSSPTTAPSISPLQTILKTLFGKNKLDSNVSLPPSEQNLVNMEISPAPMLDPIVQRFGQISKEKVDEDEGKQNHPKEELNPGIGCGMEEDEGDRPYDPEEEYNPGMGYGVEEDEDDRSYDPSEEFNPGMTYGLEEGQDDRPYDPEEEYNSGMTYGVEDGEDDRPYDPEEEYNSGMTYGVEEDEDDRPYDPEEEYNPGMGYGVGPAQKVQTSMLSKAFSNDDVAYDPEDEIIIEEVKGSATDSPHQMKGQISPKIDCVSGGESLTLTEQRKMLEELNKQIEEHEREVAEQEEALRQQRAAVGVSLAHFSVSEALMSPPLKPYIANSELLQLSRKEEMAKIPAAPVINQRRDPRQRKDPQQAAANQKLKSDRVEKDSDAEFSVEHSISLKLDRISQSPMVTPPESVYLDARSSEVSITSLEEKINPEMHGDFLQESAVKKKSSAEIEVIPYANCQNSASILKDKELSSLQSSGSKLIKIPYRSILRNKTSQRSSELPGISHDVTRSNTSMVDTYESTMPSVGVKSPDFRGPEEMPHSVPFRSSRKSFPVHESPLFQGESDQPQFRDSKFQPTVPCPPYQNRRGEKMHTVNPCRRLPSEVLVPRCPDHSSPVSQKRPPAKFEPSRSSLLPNNIGQRGLSPDQFMEGSCSPPPLDVQNYSHQLSSSFSCSGSRRPHIRQIHNGGPRLTNLHGSRGHHHHRKFMDHTSQKPPLGTLRLPDDQECNSVSYQQHMEIKQGQTPHMYRESQGSSQTHYSRAVGEIGGQRFRPPQDFGPPRVPSPHLHSQRVPLDQYTESFENQKGPQLSNLKRQRGLPTSQFGEPHDIWDNFTDGGGQLSFGFEGQNHMLKDRLLRRSGPLLPTPIEGPIALPHHMGNRPDYHRKDWRHSPDMRIGVKGDPELHNESRERMFGGYHHDEVEAQVPPCLSVERQWELSGDGRRERDDSHSRLWDRDSSKYGNSEQERECSRGREVEKRREGDDNDKRDRDQDYERGRVRHRDWNRRDGERSRIRDRNKDQECDRYFREGRQVQSRSRDRARHHDRDHGRDKGRDIEKDWDWRERSKRKEKRKELLSEAPE